MFHVALNYRPNVFTDVEPIKSIVIKNADFIDPMHHERATGRPSINLDGWMLNRLQAEEAFNRHVADADIAIVEGVMGLFDGRDGVSEAGSTAQIAKWLDAPVALVLDCSAVARSAAAIVKGYQAFDPEVRLEALILNKVAGEAHTKWLTEAVHAAGLDVTVLGGLPDDESVAIEERYLGLHLPSDPSVPSNLIHNLEMLVKNHIDLEKLLSLVQRTVGDGEPAQETSPDSKKSKKKKKKEGAIARAGIGKENASTTCELQEKQDHESISLACSMQAGIPEQPVRIAVAQDAAFCFYYHDNLTLLRQAGADLVFFSPLTDPLPHGVAGVYLGGGYPERHVVDLAENKLLRAGLKAFAEAGGVVYAECGGLLYLCQSIQPKGEPPQPMVGLFSFKAIMPPGAYTMGYVEIEATESCPIFPAGMVMRGHVHHASELVEEHHVGGVGGDKLKIGVNTTSVPVVDMVRGDAHKLLKGWSTTYITRPQIPGAKDLEEGYTVGQKVLASFVHLHWGGCPKAAKAFVQACRAVDVNSVDVAVLASESLASTLEGASVTSVTPSAISAFSRGHSLASTTATTVFADARPLPPAYVPSIPTVRSSPDFHQHQYQYHHQHQHQRQCQCQHPQQCHPHHQPHQHTTASFRAASADLGRPLHLLPHPGAAPVSKVVSSGSLINYHSHHPSLLHNHPMQHAQHSCQTCCQESPLQLSPRSSLLQFAEWPTNLNALHHGAGVPNMPAHLNVDRCSAEEEEPAPGVYPANDKLVTIGAGAAEMAWALGLGNRIVGISDDCDVDPSPSGFLDGKSNGMIGNSVLKAVVVGRNGSRKGKDGNDSAITVDEAVLAHQRPGLVVYQPYLECKDGVESMDENVLLNAISSAGLRASCRILSLRRATTMNDVLEDMVVLGEAAGVGDEASRSVDRLRARLRRVAIESAKANGVEQLANNHQHQQHYQQRPRVLLLSGVTPLRTIGRWAAEAITLVGCVPLGSVEPGDPERTLTWDEVVRMAPDVIVVAGMKDGGSGVLMDLASLATAPGWWLLPAVKNGAVFSCERTLLHRAGPRLVDGIEALARIVHGDKVSVCCPPRAVMKLSLRPGQRCRPRLLPNYFVAYC